MLHQTTFLSVTASDGIAVLAMKFAGVPVNALDLPRLRELEQAIRVIEAKPGIEIVVIRSALPAGFCGGFTSHAYAGLHDDTQAAMFAKEGQDLLSQLKHSPLISVAFIEGPCLGPGLELALACDYRIGVSGPTSRIGFGETPICWGGATRLTELVGWQRARRLLHAPPVSARAAVKCGLFDDAFCERRGKIELRTRLDQLQARPRKRRAPWRSWFSKESQSLLEERRTFREALRVYQPTPEAEIAPSRLTTPFELPASVAVVGDSPELFRLVVELTLRGVPVALIGTDSGLSSHFSEAIQSGRVTPLEVEQAQKRLAVHHPLPPRLTALWVITDGSVSCEQLTHRVQPRTVICAPSEAVFDSPRINVGYRFTAAGRVLLTTTENQESDSLLMTLQWFRDLGWSADYRDCSGWTETDFATSPSLDLEAVNA